MGFGGGLEGARSLYQGPRGAFLVLRKMYGGISNYSIAILILKKFKAVPSNINYIINCIPLIKNINTRRTTFKNNRTHINGLKSYTCNMHLFNVVIRDCNIAFSKLSRIPWKMCCTFGIKFVHVHQGAWKTNVYTNW